MTKPKDYPNNIYPITKKVKIPVYSSLRYEDGEFVGEIEGYIDTPIEWLNNENERNVH